jgi:predicted LPLAT superfamily acyltransferase
VARVNRSGHWAQYRERGNFRLMKFTVDASRVLGRRLLAPLLYAIVLYFFCTGRRARAAAREYQRHLAAWSGRAELQPTRRSVFRQFMAFADALLDKIDVWHGRIGFERVDIDDPTGIRPQAHQHEGRGQMLVGAHLGNLEVCRALAEVGRKVQMNVLVHTRHAEHFNRLLGESGASHLRLIEVSDLNAGVMLQLSQRLERGEWLAIAADRVPLQGTRSVNVDFLGQPAAFPQGPWLLAGLLQCPVSLLFCLKHDGRYRISLEPFAERIQWRRNDRQQVIRDAAQRYATRLGERCLSAPLQWFNFYPFWKLPHDSTSA